MTQHEDLTGDPSRDGVLTFAVDPVPPRPDEWRAVRRRVHRRQQRRAAVAGAAVLAAVAPALLLVGSVRDEPRLLNRADRPVQGVVVSEGLSRNHVLGPVVYPQQPPVGGDHNPRWAQCGRYDRPVANEYAVHSMEHGAVWLTYRPDLPDKQVQALAAVYDEKTAGHLLMTPNPRQDQPIIVSAWQLQLAVDDAADDRIGAFIDAYQNGPQTPEKGATCRAGVVGDGAGEPVLD